MEIADLVRQRAENGAQDIWSLRQITRSEAVADFVGCHRWHESELNRKLRRDCSARRSDQFMRLVDLSERDAAENLKRRWGRDGECTVRALHRAMAVLESAAIDLFHAERFDADAGQNDVSDAVESADFMEVNGLGRLSVNLSFRHGDAVKNRDGALFDEIRELALLDEFANLLIGPAVTMVVMVMPVVMLIMAVFVTMLLVVMVVAMPMIVVFFLVTLRL